MSVATEGDVRAVDLTALRDRLRADGAILSLADSPVTVAR
jgi:hypothetical protein